MQEVPDGQAEHTVPWGQGTLGSVCALQPRQQRRFGDWVVSYMSADPGYTINQTKPIKKGIGSTAAPIPNM